uniref:beta strand repeat-containing protein n=1 Tax=Novosphingobium sp. TaxID=1874826 RepID=UPI00286AF960
MAIRVDTDGNGTFDQELNDPTVTLPTITDVPNDADSKLDVVITAPGSSAVIDGVIFRAVTSTNAGTGVYNTFLAIGDNDGNEAGFNSDDTPPIDATNVNIDQAKTHTVLLANVPITVINGVQYYEVRIDINDANNVPNALISLDTFKVYTSTSNAIESTTQLFAQTKIFDIDDNGGGDISIMLSDAQSSGSGNDDYSILIPVSKFGGANPATTYFYIYAELGFAGGDYVAGSTFEEFNLQDAVTLVGTKFNDLDSDGVRDANEVGVGGVTVFIDTDKDGVLDADERSTVTDSNGNYTFYSTAAGTYQIDEVIPAGSTQTTGAFETITISSNQAGTHGTYVIAPIGNHYPIPNISIDKAFVNITDGPDAGSASTTVINGAGDVANYTIAVTNNGETALTGVVVTDTLSDSGAVAVLKTGGFNSGDTDSDNVLDVAETWLYTATQTATQADLDTNGGGDSDKDNSATVVATQQGTSNTVTATDAAAAPIVRAPSIAITKVFNNWSGGDGDTIGDFAGDVANYTIIVTNTGNVTLTSVVVTDPLTGNVYNVGTLAPGGSSAPLSETYTLTQADLDSNGTSEVNSILSGSIENTATATSGQTGPASASAVAPITVVPQIAIDKTFVNWSGGNGDAIGNAAGDVANYTVKVTNTGNVTLTNVTVVDP